MPTKNKEKLREYRRTWYARNKERAKRKTVERRKDLIAWLKEYKSTLECEECGENHPACLDFHHMDPSKKEQNIHKCPVMGWSKERIMSEIAKCKVLCSNCHRKLHYDERGL